MGVLWVARHESLGEEVVVKFLRDDREPDTRAAKRVAREAAAAARVRSSHVVQILDHGVSDGSPFLVMELLRGKDLQTLLRERGALSLDETVTIVRQIAKALAILQARGLVHRDVKPSNLFLVHGEGELLVKLLDFGLARDAAGPDASTDGGRLGAGTAPYMSPEQIAGEPLDARSDVWSLGVVAFECLTGSRPFQGETLGATALAIHFSPLPSITALLGGLPGAIDAWFSRACARRVEDRFPTAQAASDELTRVLGAIDEASAIGRTVASGPVRKATSLDLDTATATGERARPWAASIRASHASRGWVTATAIGALGLAVWFSREPPSRADSDRAAGLSAPAAAPTERKVAMVRTPDPPAGDSPTVESSAPAPSAESKAPMVRSAAHALRAKPPVEVASDPLPAATVRDLSRLPDERR
jgi:serine/threonine protein kinase